MPNQPPHTAPPPKPQTVSLASDHLVDSPKPQLVFFAFFRWLSERGKNPWLAAVSHRELTSAQARQNHYWAGVSTPLSNWNTPYTFSGKEKDEEIKRSEDSPNTIENKQGMKKLNKVFLLLVFMLVTIFFSSCASTRIDRIVKRHSKIIRETNVILVAEKQSSFASIQLKIREQHVFDFLVSSMISEYYSGTWEYRNDTIFFDYFKNHKPEYFSNFALYDTIYKKIVFKNSFDGSAKDIVLDYNGCIK